jgi:hypothetical protein
MTRVLMLVVLVVAVTTTLAEARANRIHVTVKIVQTTATGDPGIDLKRDSLTSVMYAEALNSATSSVTLQSTDRHGILGQKPTHFQLSL